MRLLAIGFAVLGWGAQAAAADPGSSDPSQDPPAPTVALAALVARGEPTVTLPPGGAYVDAPLELNRDLTIHGSAQPLVIRGAGRLIVDVEADAQISIANARIYWTLDPQRDYPADARRHLAQLRGATGARKRMPSFAAIVLERGRLIIEHNSLQAEVSAVERTDDDPVQLLSGQPPFAWFIATPRLSSRPAAELRLDGNRMTSLHRYGAGLLGLGSRSVRLVLRDNDIRNFHGVLNAVQLEDSTIAGNRLYRNSFANFGIAGDRLRIADNRILYPGNGGPGDGISLSGGTSIVIESNEIFGGTCYGIWIHGGARALDGIRIVDNRISEGITSGLYIDVDPPHTVGSVLVRDNLFARNLAWGLAATGVRQLHVVGNVFHENAQAADGAPQHWLGEVGESTWSDNLESDAMTAEHVLGAHDYRNTVHAYPAPAPAVTRTTPE